MFPDPIRECSVFCHVVSGGIGPTIVNDLPKDQPTLDVLAMDLVGSTTLLNSEGTFISCRPNPPPTSRVQTDIDVNKCIELHIVDRC